MKFVEDVGDVVYAAYARSNLWALVADDDIIGVHEDIEVVLQWCKFHIDMMKIGKEGPPKGLSQPEFLQQIMGHITDGLKKFNELTNLDHMVHGELIKEWHQQEYGLDCCNTGGEIMTENFIEEVMERRKNDIRFLLDHYRTYGQALGPDQLCATMLDDVIDIYIGAHHHNPCPSHDGVEEVSDMAWQEHKDALGKYLEKLDPGKAVAVENAKQVLMKDLGISEMLAGVTIETFVQENPKYAFYLPPDPEQFIDKECRFIGLAPQEPEDQ